MSDMLERCGYWLSCWLTCRRPWHRVDGRFEGDLLPCLKPGDVLLVEGSSRLSTVIKYLTQSSWSHAALFVGRETAQSVGGKPGDCFVEVDLAEGVRLVGIDEFKGMPLRICRPVGLKPSDIQSVIRFVCQRQGYRYDLRNIFDLARYLMPLPPVPTRWRRRMLTLGSGDPTRAICSTLIAQAFQSVHYPILPIEEHAGSQASFLEPMRQQLLLRRRHYSLFTPRDFDLSPYFQIVKPKLVNGFNPYQLCWNWEESSLLIPDT